MALKKISHSSSLFYSGSSGSSSGSSSSSSSGRTASKHEKEPPYRMNARCDEDLAL
jgi:hypothetical protein